MSQTAYDLFGEALNEQHARNEARRIRTRVHEARGSPHTAGFRWPFELLQNALDSGSRSGNAVEVCFRRKPNQLLFEHNGAPFTSQELAALLSGGSSKEFESETTTGRFGTGFLVTHVLAERTLLRGLLRVPNGVEVFEFTLDRGGDEESILANNRQCNESIRQASHIELTEGMPSASFTYITGDDRTLVMGLEALSRSLPYLFATRETLGRVELENIDGTTEVWLPGPIHRTPLEGGSVESRQISVATGQDTSRQLTVFRFALEDARSAAALILVEQHPDGQLGVVLPEPDAPRIYREYPLRGSGFVPLNLVLDGKFEPDQERTKLLMNDVDKQLLAEAFGAAAIAVRHAFHQGWVGAHYLAHANPPRSAFDPTNTEETSWWTAQLGAFATHLSQLPIVEGAEGWLSSAGSINPHADFLVPTLNSESTSEESSVSRMWPLVAAAADLRPPKEELAREWSEIADGWHRLGVKLSRVTVGSLGRRAIEGATSLNELRIKGDPLDWLVRFLDIVGECWRARGGVDLAVLKGLFPDQTGRLRSPAELYRDAGISSELKAICLTVGQDVQSRLLMQEVARANGTSELKHLAYALEQALPNMLSEGQVIEEVIRHLDEIIPEDESCDDDTVQYQIGSTRLLLHLANTQGKGGAALAKKVPLITAGKTSVRWSQDRMMLAPAAKWDSRARPFANAYPPNRVLADLYAGSADGSIPSTLECLVEFGIAIADPLTSDTPSELRAHRLQAIAQGESDGVTVSGVLLSQVALLQPEVLNRCQEGIDEAKCLLGLVLCYIAPQDQRWREIVSVAGRRAREDVKLNVRGALWLADLKSRAWVPVPGEDGKPIKMRAEVKTLEHLLDAKWLEGNEPAIALLSEEFGFDELELRLLGLAPDPGRRRELRGGIAKLVETGGSDPSFYTSLASQIDEQRRQARDIERFKKLGLAVQAAIQKALEARGLKVKLVDHGFDYEVSNPNVYESAAATVQVGSYLLEIKATTIGEARLTPTQAETAAKEPARFVLCVVDLRGLTDEELSDEWTADRVTPLAKLASGVGTFLGETCELIADARESTVGIRNEAALRYEVPESLWKNGTSIDSWIAQLVAAS